MQICATTIFLFKDSKFNPLPGFELAIVMSKLFFGCPFIPFGQTVEKSASEFKKHEKATSLLCVRFFPVHFVGQGTTALTSWETSLASYRFLLAMACWLGHMQCSTCSEWKKNKTAGHVWEVQTKMKQICLFVFYYLIHPITSWVKKGRICDMSWLGLWTSWRKIMRH